MSGTQELQKVLDLFEQRIAAVESKVGVAGPPPPPATSSENAPQVAAFDAYCSKSLEPFVQACASLNAKEATECADHVKQAWSAMRGFIVAASVSKKPANFPGDCMALIKPCQAAMQGASKAISRGDWVTSEDSEGACSATWLITSRPEGRRRSYIRARPYTRSGQVQEDERNKSRSATRSKVDGRMSYVKEYHLTGVTFNPGGDGRRPSPPRRTLRPPFRRRRPASRRPWPVCRTPTTSSPRACARSRRTSRPGARSFPAELRPSSRRKRPPYASRT